MRNAYSTVGPSSRSLLGAGQGGQRVGQDGTRYDRRADDDNGVDGVDGVVGQFETIPTQSDSQESVVVIPIVFMDQDRASPAEVPIVDIPTEGPSPTDADLADNDQVRDAQAPETSFVEEAVSSSVETGAPAPTETSTATDSSDLSGGSASITETSQPHSPSEAITIQSALQSDEPQSVAEPTEGPTTSIDTPEPLPTFSSTFSLITSNGPTPTPPSLVTASFIPTTSSILQTSSGSTMTTPQSNPPSSTSSLLVASTPLSITSLSPTPSEQATSSARPTRSDPGSAAAATTSRASNAAALATRGPQFYVAVVLGAIFAITCVAAIVAWFIRLRSHTRQRRHEDEIVASVFAANTPRVERGDGGYGRFEHGYMPHTRDVGYNEKSIHRFGRGGAMGGFRGLQSIEEVSEPGSLGRNGYHPSTLGSHPPSFEVGSTYGANRIEQHSENSLGSFGSEVRSALHLDEPAPAHLPNPYASNSSSGTLHDIYTQGHWQVTNMMPEDIISSSEDDRRRSTQRLVDGQRHPHFTGTSSDLVYGTPRESYPGMRPRYLGVEGDGLRVPWKRELEPVAHGKYDERYRGKFEATAAPTDTARTREHWAGTLKSNLVNAFNAVAAGLSGVSPMSGAERKQGEPEDIYTRRPLRRQGSSTSDLIRRLSTLGPSNPRQPALSRHGSATSCAWSLEETNDGAGIVRIHYRGPTGGSFSRTPSNKTIRQTDVSTRSTDEMTDIPAKPCPVFLKPGERRSSLPEGLQVPDRPDMVKRGSSLYSASSARSSMFGYPSSSGEEGVNIMEGTVGAGASRANSTRTGVGSSGKLTPRASRKRSKARRPSVLHRTSSSSITAYPTPDRSHSILSQLRGKELVAMKALQDRQRRTRRSIKSKIT